MSSLVESSITLQIVHHGRFLPTRRILNYAILNEDAHDRGYTVEQLWGSAMMKDGNDLQYDSRGSLATEPDNGLNQCMHEARDERGWLIQKATGLFASIKYTKTALRCSGHRGQGHSQHQGQAPNGLSRTSMAAVYPQIMCQRMKVDILRFLGTKQLLRIKSWPKELSRFTAQHFYDFLRCQLGRACPKSTEHSTIPGQCGHGKWAEGAEPPAKGDPSNDGRPPPTRRPWSRSSSQQQQHRALCGAQSLAEEDAHGAHQQRPGLVW